MVISFEYGMSSTSPNGNLCNLMGVSLSMDTLFPILLVGDNKYICSLLVGKSLCVRSKYSKGNFDTILSSGGVSSILVDHCVFGSAMSNNVVFSI